MRVYLTPVKAEDGKEIVKWRNSAKVKAHCFTKSPITEESNSKFFHDYIETGKYKQYLVNRVDDQYGVISYPIATVYLKDMDYENNRCELCVFTSDDQEWNTESQSIAIKMLIEKAFKEFHMHKVFSYVFADNKDEVELLKSSGMHEEALLKNEAKDINGKYTDVYRMSIFNEQ